MTALEAALRAVGADLSEAGVRFALVGGLAVSVRTEPRFTRDADLVVAVEDDDEAEALIRRLRGSGYEIEAVLEQDAVARLATVRLTRTGGPVEPVIDLLFASSGIEREVVAAAEPLELLPSLTMPVALTGHLIALKAGKTSNALKISETCGPSSASPRELSWLEPKRRSRSSPPAAITVDAMSSAK